MFHVSEAIELGQNAQYSCDKNTHRAEIVGYNHLFFDPNSNLIFRTAPFETDALTVACDQK